MRKSKIKWKGIAALLLCIAMVLGVFDGIPGMQGVMTTEVYAKRGGTERLNLQQLQARFPNGKYWNHYVENQSQTGDAIYGKDDSFADSVTDFPCHTHAKDAKVQNGWYDCNNFDSGLQCCGFARRLAYLVYGNSDWVWDRAGYSTNLNNLKPGDVIRYSDAHTSRHYVMVTDVNGNCIKVGEANYGYNDHCRIRWGRTIDTRSFYSVAVYSAPYELPRGQVKTESPSISEQSGTAQQVYTTETSFSRRAVFKNPNGKKILRLGMMLLDANKNEINHRDEGQNAYGVGSRTKTSYIWESTDADFGITLTPGTQYYYKFYIQTEEGLFYSPDYGVKTLGDVVPKKPSLSVDKTDVAAGDIVNVSWQADSAAVNGYTVNVKGTGGNSYTRTIDIQDKNASSVSIILPKAGTYQVTAYAKGTKNSETAVLAKTLTAHAPLTVSFVQNTDKGEEVLKTEEVAYGHDATPPVAPKREGYTFQGWDSNYRNVTGDIKVTAKYTINTYKITFQNEDGSVLKEEKVKYLESATPPENPTTDKVGYTFMGWSSNDYQNVKANAIIKASFGWANDKLPIVVTPVSCVYGDGGYTLTYNMTNYPTAKTSGRAIASLKTSGGKLVATTESSAFTMAKGATKSNQEIFIPYEGAAASVDIVIVDKFSTGIPISASKNVAATKEWSNWSTTKPDSSYTVESRTEYRYRDKQTTTSTASSLNGWTKYNTTWVWGNYGNWSSWSRNSYSGSDSRQVETRSVTDSNAYSVNNFYFYRYWNSSAGKYYYTYSSSMGGTKYTYSESAGASMQYYNTYSGHAAYRASGGCKKFGDELWFLESTTNVPATSHTEWRYRDRGKNYTYYYYKWGDWSGWQTGAVSGSDSRQVETRTVYRYKAKVEGEEDNSGTVRTVKGKVASKFSGKQATLLVYKNEEAADYNNEYVGQTTIGSDGSYSFTFKTREEVSAKTGDFTIDLALEGASEPIYLDTIKAPLPVYTVNFTDWDGTILSTQQVTEGETAVLPENPTREQYHFTGWDTGTTNIHDNLTLTAQYEKNQYTVIWVDWSRKNFEVANYYEGDELVVPALAEVEGYELSGWMDENGEMPTKVTDNMILTAEYTVKSYTVKFYDYDGQCISTQDVAYGKSAAAPQTAQKEGMSFVGWSSADYTCVKSDLELYPNYIYLETAEVPTISVASGAYDGTFRVKLSAADGTEIHYTTDGTTPNQYSTLYTEEIPIEKNTVLQAIACAGNKNSSSVQKAVYLISETEDTDGILKIKRSTWNLLEGNTEQFEYTLYRSDGKNEVELYSLNEDVVSVDENGKMSANGVGSTQIFAITSDYKYADYCTVNVTSDEVEVTGISLENSVYFIAPDETAEIEAQVEPYNATHQDINWTSSDSEIASVDDDGTVTAKAYGTAYLRGYSHTGNCYVDCAVVVAEPSVELNDTAIAVEKGKTYKESVYVTGNLTQKFTWSSADQTIATVDQDGVISGIAEGQTTVSYTSEDGTYKKDLIVIVTEKDPDSKEELQIEDVTLKQSKITYTGKAVKPEVTVVHDGTRLVGGTDYSVYYNNNVDAGTAAVYVTGKGQYSGVVEQQFTILPYDVKQLTVGEISDQIYSGAEIYPEVRVKNGKVTLSEEVDYHLTYSNNINAGTAKIKIEGIGNYTGNRMISFVIRRQNTEKTDTEKKDTDTGNSEKEDTGNKVLKKGTTFTDQKTKAKYRVTGTDSKKPSVEYVKTTNTKATSITIPQKVEKAGVTYTVTAVADSAFKNNRKIQKVTIGNNVVTIGKYAFKGCTKLKKLSIGKNVTTIENQAFFGCTVLIAVVLPEKVKKIGTQAFCGDKKLKTITIKTKKLTAKTVGKKAFSGIYAKAVVKVPKSKLNVYKKILKSKEIGSKAVYKKM